MEFLKNVSNVKVLIIGDVMLDCYWWGTVNRVSPEAPVPVVNLERISTTLGGAANVAANVAGLGAEPLLIGITGEDEDAEKIIDALESRNISAEFLLKSAERPTTVKTRIIAHNQQIVRVDQEAKAEQSSRAEEKIWEIAAPLIKKAEIIVVSDYAKGLLTKNLLKRLITKANKENKFILIDPKGKSFTKYTGATMLTPNRLEIMEACGLNNISQKSIEKIGSQMLSELDLKYLLVTQGEDGMTLFEKNRETLHLPVEQRNVYDVTGAGDTVIACLAVSMGAEADFLQASAFANRAAGLVIEKVGTTAITLEMLKQTFES